MRLSGSARGTETRVSEIEAKDIVSSIGTLIGLLFAAFGLLEYAPHIAPESLAIIGRIALIMMVPFSITATTAAYSTVTGRLDAQEVARGIFPVSWVVFCFGVFAIFGVLVVGPASFIFTIPYTHETTDWPSLLIVLVGVVVGSLMAARSIRAARRTLMMRALLYTKQSATEDANEGTLDITTSRLLSSWIDLEKSIQAAAAKLGVDPKIPVGQLVQWLLKNNQIQDTEVELIQATQSVRNRVVRGGDVLPGDLKGAQVTLDQLKKTFSQLPKETKNKQNQSE